MLVSTGAGVVAVADGGTGVDVCGMGVRDAGIGDEVKVAVGGRGVLLGVDVKVGGRKGVHVGAGE